MTSSLFDHTLLNSGTAGKLFLCKIWPYQVLDDNRNVIIIYSKIQILKSLKNTKYYLKRKKF